MVCSQADRRGYLRRRPAAQEPAVPICAAAAGVEYTIRCVLGPDAAVQGGWTTGKLYYNTPGAENQPYFAESSRQQSVRCGRSAQGPLCAVGALCKPPRRKAVRPNGGRAGGVPATPPAQSRGACGRSGPGRSVNRGAAAAPRPRGTFRTAGAKAAWMPVQAQRRLRGGWRRSGSGRCAPSGLRALPCPAGHFCLGGCFLAGAAGVLSGASSPGSVPFCSSPPFSRDSSRAQA